jgi:hypothetical protein
MSEPLAILVSRLGLDCQPLSMHALDRVLVVETLRPEWRRERKVRFIKSGVDDGLFPTEPISDRPSIIERLFTMPKTEQTERMRANYRRLKIERIMLHLGYHGAALLPRHQQIFEQIADAAAVDAELTRPLDRIKARDLPQVRALVNQLPKTAEIRQFLETTKNGPVKHLI